MSNVSSKLSRIFKRFPDDHIRLRHDVVNNRCIICEGSAYNSYPIVTFEDIINNKIPTINKIDDYIYKMNKAIVSLNCKNNAEFYNDIINLEKIQTVIAVAMMFDFPVSPKFFAIDCYGGENYVIISNVSVIINIGDHLFLLTSIDSNNDDFELCYKNSRICDFKISDGEFIKHLKYELWKHYEIYFVKNCSQSEIYD